MKYCLLCLVVLLRWVTLSAGEPISCVTKVRTLIGVSESALAQAFKLFKENDTAALQVLVDRGQVIMVKPGTQVRTEEEEKISVMRVRLPGQPDTLYTYRDYLDCPK